MSKRTKRETLIDMLNILAVKPLKPTHLLYKANLSHSRMKKLLDELEKNGLVVREEGQVSITAKGRKFLLEYTKAQELFDSFGL